MSYQGEQGGKMQPQEGQLAQVKQQAQQQINSAIDMFASKLPGGAVLSQPAKNAASGILDNLEQTATGKISNLGDVGGMLGGILGQKQEP